MCRYSAWISLLTLTIIISIIFCSKPSIATTEKVIFRYGILEESITIEELKSFAKDGKLPTGFDQYIRRANSTSDSIHNVLTQELPILVDLQLLDQALNMLLGEIALDKLGEVIYTPTRSANRQALRAAIILSAKDDAKISLLEVIENYPTQEMIVDISHLSSAYSELTEFLNPQRLVNLVQGF